MRVSEEIVRQERSVPVQGRVDILVLADLAMYLVNKGYRIGTQSTLIAHIAELLHYVIESNGMLEGRHETIGDAYQNLMILGLYKGKAAQRGVSKINMGWGFENMRLEGDDPEQLASAHYKKLHNQHSVQTPGIANPVVPSMKTKESYYERNRQWIEGNKNKEMLDESEERTKKIIADMRAREDENGVISPLPPFQSKVEEVECTFEERKTWNPEKIQAWRLKEQRKRAEEHKNKVKENNNPRPKTEDELLADAERIAKKDRDIATADMSAPKGKAIDD